MKVLHIITRLDPGGSATNTIVSVDLLRKHGFITSLAYGVTDDPEGSIAQYLEDRNIPVFKLQNLVRNPSLAKDFLAFEEIRRILKTGTYDLVHTHSSKAGVLGRLAASIGGIPSVHTPHGHIFYGYFGNLLTKVFVLIERWMARKTKRIISLTDLETKESLENKIGKPEQYVTIHSGVPLAKFRSIHSSPETGKSFRSEFSISPEAFLFVSTGRLTHVKGFDTLLQAFAQSHFGGKPAFLAIVGDGEDRKSLELLCLQLGLMDHVKFTGQLKDVRPALSAANAFVLASRNEGMGRVLIEAMSSGLPVIGTAVGGIPAIIKNNHTGIIVPPENPAALAIAMEELARNPETCDIMGKNASEYVYPEYDENTMIEKLARLYREVANISTSH